MARGRSRSEWARVVRSWHASGETAQAFAEQEGLNVSTLRWWQSELRRTGELPAVPKMLPVRVVETVASAVATIDLAVGDVRLRFPAGTDPEYLGELVRALLDDDGAC